MLGRSSINHTLVWAAAAGGHEPLAWDEFRRSLLSTHQAAFPDQWIGVWSVRCTTMGSAPLVLLLSLWAVVTSVIGCARDLTPITRPRVSAVAGRGTCFRPG